MSSRSDATGAQDIHPQPRVLWGGMASPGSLQDTRVPAQRTCCPAGLHLWCFPPPPFVPHPSTALPLQLGSFWALWALGSISTHESLLTPSPAEDAEGTRAVLGLTDPAGSLQAREGSVGLGLAGQQGLHPAVPPAPCRSQHSISITSATATPDPSLQAWGG